VQQPVRQNWPSGHSGRPGTPQSCSAGSSQTSIDGVPPSESVPPSGAGEGKQSSGRSSASRPRQSSQRPQVFRHASTGVQAWQPSRSSGVQVGVPLSSTEPMNTHSGAPPGPAGSSQHPKQSQPFGTSGPQKSAHAAVCSAGQVADGGGGS